MLSGKDMVSLFIETQEYMITLLRIIYDIPRDQRTDVINHAKPLFNDTMNVQDKCQLIAVMCGIAQLKEPMSLTTQSLSSMTR